MTTLDDAHSNALVAAIAQVLQVQPQRVALSTVGNRTDVPIETSLRVIALKVTVTLDVQEITSPNSTDTDTELLVNNFDSLLTSVKAQQEIVKLYIAALSDAGVFDSKDVYILAVTTSPSITLPPTPHPSSHPTITDNEQLSRSRQDSSRTIGGVDLVVFTVLVVCIAVLLLVSVLLARYYFAYKKKSFVTNLHEKK